MKKPAVKRKGLNSTLNTSSTLNRSIATYGKVQIRFLQDIPCSNWLPPDDSIGGRKKKDIFSDDSNSFSTMNLAAPEANKVQNNLFDSDSDDDDFKVPVKKRRKCLTTKQNVKPNNNTKSKVTSKRNNKKAMRKVPKPEKAGKEKNLANEYKKSSENEENAKPNFDTEKEIITTNNEYPISSEQFLTEASSEKVTDSIQNTNLQQFDTKSRVTNGLSLNKTDEQSLDMFTNAPVMSTIFTEQNNSTLASPQVIESQRSNNVGNDRNERQKDNILKSILKDPIIHSINSSRQSLEDNNISSCSKHRVSFNSTVMYHAANIEMDDENVPIPSGFSVHNQGWSLSNNQPMIAQSTPLHNKPSHRLLKANIQKEVEKDDQNCKNDPKNSKQKKQTVDCVQSRGTQPDNKVMSKNSTALKVAPTTVKNKKVAAKRAPVQTKRKPKRVPVWKKNGGSSFCKLSKIGKSNNDSIHHQIMIGATVDPKYNFLDNSDDAYFVDSKSEDSIRVKLTSSKPLAKQSDDSKKLIKKIVTKNSDKPPKKVRKKPASDKCTTQSKDDKKSVHGATADLPRHAQFTNKTQSKKTETKPYPRSRVTTRQKNICIESSLLQEIAKTGFKPALVNNRDKKIETSNTQEDPEIEQICRRSSRNKRIIDYKCLLKSFTTVYKPTTLEKSSSASKSPTIEDDGIDSEILTNKTTKATTKEKDLDESKSDSNFDAQHLQHIEERRRKPICPNDLALSDSGSLFSSLSFNSSTEKSKKLSETMHDTKEPKNVINSKGTAELKKSMEPPRKSCRNTKPINYKDLSQFGNAVYRSNKRTFNGFGKNLRKSSKNFSTEMEDKPIHLNHSEQNSFVSTEITNLTDDTHGDFAPSKMSNVEKPQKDSTMINDYICDRRHVDNKRRGKKTAPVISSDSSSLFSTLHRTTENHSTSITVPLHAFSTINKSNSDDENHGNILSDDENVNTNAGVAKRMSTPIVSRSPGLNKPSIPLFNSVSVHGPITNIEHGTTPKLGNISLPSSVASPIITSFSPIPNMLPETGDNASDLSPVDLPQRQLGHVIHPRISHLRHQSTPNCMSSPDACNSYSRMRKLSQVVKRKKNEKSTTRTPHRARSPGSHLSSSIIKVDFRYNCDLMSEERRRTLDSIKLNLTSLIIEEQNSEKNEIEQDSSSLMKTRSKSSHSTQNLQVCVTPMRNSFMQHVISSGGSIRLKSLGFVDALTPKRAISNDGRILTAKEKVLYECEQTEPISFEEALQGVVIESCTKLGEGLYGEVFRCKYESRTDPVAIKIIPIEGSLIINNEKQKTFEEILPEIISSKELHALREGVVNVTDGFIELYKVTCVKGSYPQFLLEAWDVYDEERTSENDKPDNFSNDQLYLIFQFADGGADVEHFVFRSANQAYSVLQQVCAALAVAEKSLEFEHRDLHWGNILVTPTTSKTVTTNIDSKAYTIKTNGVKASIIDFTLSRLSKGGVTVFQNLAADPDLFTLNSDEDYQFEIYRMMKNATKNNWSTFEPKNNIFWLHYLNDKFYKEVQYRNKKSKVHRCAFAKLRQLGNEIMQYKSCFDAFSSILFGENA
uniref:uncharacterized protein LOC120327576 n=1 Tax=Styela clava TaxID=7725 RepID=UPI00193ABEC6|nr:uncharacterized protein LOC120327576 [Styela clava]